MKIGLSAEEIDAILIKEIRTGQIASAEGHRSVIAEVIEKNNAKLLEDIKKLLKD